VMPAPVTERFSPEPPGAPLDMAFAANPAYWRNAPTPSPVTPARCNKQALV